MKIRCWPRALVKSLWTILLGGVFSGLAGVAGAQIPLHLKTVPGPEGGYRQQLWIYLGINNTMHDEAPVVRPYLFDTGSAMFNAAWYSGTNPNPNAWSPGATLLSNTTYSYGAGSDSLNVVTVSSIQVYQSANATTPVYNFDPTAINPASTGYVVGQVFDSTMAPNPHHTNFQDALEINVSPYLSGVFGTFGAGMFTSIVGSHPNTVTVGSVLGQSTTTGWAVVANTPSTSQPFVILGLDNATRAQFSSHVEWESTGNTPFPNSGANSGKEFDTMFHYSVENGNSHVTWSAATLLDTGTADTNIYSTTAHDSLLTAGLLSDGKVINTSTFRATGHPPLDNQPFTFVTDSSYMVDGHTVPTLSVDSLNQNGASGDPVTTIGINFFLNNSVAFDLENQQTLYTSQVVPEPSTALLAVILGVLFLILRSVHRRRRAGLGEPLVTGGVSWPICTPNHL